MQSDILGIDDQAFLIKRCLLRTRTVSGNQIRIKLYNLNADKQF